MTILHINISSRHTLLQLTITQGKSGHRPNAWGSCINQCRPPSSWDKLCPTSLPGEEAAVGHLHKLPVDGLCMAKTLGPRCTTFPCKAKVGGSLEGLTKAPTNVLNISWPPTRWLCVPMGCSVFQTLPYGVFIVCFPF